MGFRVNGCGTYDKTIKLYSAGQYFCTHCNRETAFYVNEMQRKITVFYVPVARISRDYAVLCDSCDKGYLLTETQMQKARGGDQSYIRALLCNDPMPELEPAPEMDIEIERAQTPGDGEAESAPVTCPRCKEEVDKEIGFCPRCGTSL